MKMPNLDWAVLWQEAQAAKNWTTKAAADWDKKAPSFAERTANSVYTEQFVDLLAPLPEWTILDVGCGPGTLALPLATRCQRVTALDFSAGMLAILEQQAKEQHLDNIRSEQLAWQDNWEEAGIGVYDVVLASRSLAVPDLRQALEKMEQHTKELVVIADKVGSGPFDPDAFAAIGRPLQSGPDYIWTFNLLCQMGRLPTVDYIYMEAEQEHLSFADALASCKWQFSNLTAEEEDKLQDYVQSIAEIRADGTVITRRQQAPVWAFMTWQPQAYC
jgi:SAM-dependent methyltransferase